MRRRELLRLGALGALASCARTRGEAHSEPPASPDNASSAGGAGSKAPGSSADSQASAEPTQPSATPTGPPPADDDAALRAKIGQLLLVGFRGQRAGADDIVTRDLQDRRLGGVLLFSRDNITGKRRRNIRSPAQLRALTDELRAAAGTTPPLIAIDQEGGFVNRLLQRDGFPKTVSARRMGRFDREVYTQRMAGRIADTLADAGINLNFAPVVDLMVEPDNPIIGAVERSFSEDPEVVVRHASAFIRAHHERGILCSLKHFPGHGSSRADSHLGFVDITETWSRAELTPFAKLIKAGLADTIMTGHLFNAALDKKLPSTLSPAVIGDLLRGELGYTGVVVSDDMSMRAITDMYPFAEALRRALSAGVDILTLGNNVNYDIDTVERTIDIIAEHVATGRLKRAVIDAAYGRVQALKARIRAPSA